MSDAMTGDAGWLWAAGAINLAFAGFHILFWRMFGWPERLAGAGRLNAAITQTMNVMLIYIFAAYGGAQLWLAWKNLAMLPALLWSGAIFWSLRALLQPLLFALTDKRSRVMFAVFVVAAVVHIAAAMSAEQVPGRKLPEENRPLGHTILPS